MEELIGILVLVVVVILKIIDKKFSNASARSAQSVDQREAFPKVEVEDMGEAAPMVFEMPVFRPEPKPEPKPKPELKPELRPVAKPKEKKPILKEEVKKTREKIDPKKLVVYSEIMNRKY